jgi:hypothetical protein
MKTVVDITEPEPVRATEEVFKPREEIKAERTTFSAELTPDTIVWDTLTRDFVRYQIILDREGLLEDDI